jgi:hypothetical protein
MKILYYDLGECMPTIKVVSDEKAIEEFDNLVIGDDPEAYKYLLKLEPGSTIQWPFDNDACVLRSSRIVGMSFN